MVKSPKIRHSKPAGEPLTIELGRDDVKRVDAAAASSPDTGKAGDRKVASEPGSATVAGQPAAPGSAKPASEAQKPAPPEMSAQPRSTASVPPSGTSSTSGAAAASASSGSSSTGPARPEAPKSTEAPKAAAAAGSTSAFGRDAGKPASSTPPPPPTPREPAAARPTPASAPVPRRSGSMVLAGLLGGVIALGGAGAAWYGGMIQLPVQPAQPAAPADTAAVDGLRAEIDALRSALDELRAAPPAAPGEAADLTDVNARIESLATLVEDLRAQLGGLAEAGAGGDGAGAIVALREALAALEARVANLPAGEATDLPALREEIEAAATLARQASDSAAQAASAAGELSPRLERIEGELAALSARVEEAAKQPTVALAIAASALKAAVDRGMPFTTELDTYAGLAPDTAEVEALRPFAAAGVPTRADIESGFDEAAGAVIAAARGDNAEAGFFEKLWASALSVVEVRPIGEVQGDDAPAIVARMEVAMNRGDYARAIAEFDTLPEASRAAGTTFMEGLRARHAADELVGKVLAAALRA
jgi:hypothetical protein